MRVSREDCAALDACDALAHLRNRFALPEHIIYLDGNSLGPLPKATAPRVADVIAREWGRDLIRAGTSMTGSDCLRGWVR
jgi:kynureninase